MRSDFLVIGSGIAGLSFALKAAKLGSVVLVTKKSRIDTATNLAQGGIAAVLDKGDSAQLHIKDTAAAGAGLCDERVVKLVVDSGPERIEELIDIGVRFVQDTQSSSGLDLGKEGGHSRRRVAHAYDLTGKEIERALLEKTKVTENIRVFENHTAVDLLMLRDSSIDSKVSGGKFCGGAYVLDDQGVVEPYVARVTVLCSGGAGKAYLYTTNPDIATGDGMAMAFRGGAKIANVEFVQFHPTCLYHPKSKNFLISEAVRGEGGLLMDEEGNRFMEKYDARKELATRDTVARAIDKEMKESGANSVFLDISYKNPDFIKKRFPAIYQKCASFGLDITKEPIPVVPAAHYMCGGVVTDTMARSSIDGLLVLGESACTGLHGGNRLASNSLLEAVVFSDRAYHYCKKNWRAIRRRKVGLADPWQAGKAIALNEEILINHNWDLVRRTMWNYVGIVRTERRLQLAQRTIEGIAEEIEQHYREFFVTPNMIELRNIVLVSLMIIRNCLKRKESRGLHYMLDYPGQDEQFTRWLIFRRKKTKKKLWSVQPCAWKKHKRGLV